MKNVILRCLQCNKLFRPTRYDSHPAFHLDKETGSLREVDVDDLGSFRMEHKGHDVVELHVIDGSFCSYYAYREPVREDYLQATDGIQTYTIRRWREDIGEPLRYEIVDSRITFSKPVLQTQSLELKRQMIADAGMLELSEGKIDQLIETFEDFVSNIELEDVVECGLSPNNPMISYAVLKDGTVEEFLIQCRSLLSDEELERLRTFIDANSEYNDVMNVQVVRRFDLIPITRPWHVLEKDEATKAESNAHLS